MKLQKRGLIRPEDLPVDGHLFTVVALRPSAGEFFKYDLLLKDVKGGERTLGLQEQSINMDALIDALGEDSEKWPTKKIILTPGEWNDRKVIRVSAAARG